MSLDTGNGTDEGLADDLELSGHYGDGLAEVYDRLYPVTEGVEECAGFVAGLCPPGGSVLELGVGTGRIALRLAERGLRVHGVDASQGMLARLAENDPEGTVTATRATFTSMRLGERFDTALAAYNALCCVLSQEDQIRAIANMRDHVRPGGHLVFETFDPAHESGNGITMHPLGPGGVMFESVQAMPGAQMTFMTSALFREGAPEVTVGFMRPVHPSELDLMARICGLLPTGRYNGWSGRDFTGGGDMCVSVYRRPEEDAGE
ncbi:class I SAM-dependent methyltransferase [Nocardiopsis sp. CNT-189]|uniref:class I SAM-dependent methyltransferase n=1 Tax=Nocardiopsis oceanisediminis TaxID=2816862 RepID=UPI003B2E1AFE